MNVLIITRHVYTHPHISCNKISGFPNSKSVDLWTDSINYGQPVVSPRYNPSFLKGLLRSMMKLKVKWI